MGSYEVGRTQENSQRRDSRHLVPWRWLRSFELHPHAVWYKRPFSVLALRFVCASNVMILRTHSYHFPEREAPTESPVLKWSSADSSWTLRNSRSIVAQGATLRHGALSGLPLPLLWQGKATGTQSRGPDRAGAGPPDCSSADFLELQATSARGRARPPTSTTKPWGRHTFLGS